jgi:hypothetical protein
VVCRDLLLMEIVVVAFAVLAVQCELAGVNKGY